MTPEPPAHNPIPLYLVACGIGFIAGSFILIFLASIGHRATAARVIFMALGSILLLTSVVWAYRYGRAKAAESN